MLTSLLLAVLAQGEVAPAPSPAPPPQQQEFSDAFKKRRAWEKEQQKPSWTDHLAFAVAAYGGAGFWTEQTLARPVAAGLAVDLELGGHFTPSVSLVGLAEFKAAFPQAGTEVVTAGLGVGLRWGSKHYMTIGVGETLVSLLRANMPTQLIFAPTVELRGAIVLTGRLGIHLRAGMSFGPASVFADVGAGFGFSI
jgi:hypothetical protein